MTAVRVFVCGSPDRGDDAVAIRAVEGLSGAVRSLAEIEVCGTLGVEDLVDVPSGVMCLVLDAAVGVEPGTMVSGPLRSLADRARSAGPAPHSSHILPIDETLALAETIRGSLPEGVFLGIGARSFELGEPLSPPVEAALPGFRRAIQAEIERLASSGVDVEAIGPGRATPGAARPAGSGARMGPIRRAGGTRP